MATTANPPAVNPRPVSLLPSRTSPAPSNLQRAQCGEGRRGRPSRGSSPSLRQEDGGEGGTAGCARRHICCLVPQIPRESELRPGHFPSRSGSRRKSRAAPPATPTTVPTSPWRQGCCQHRAVSAPLGVGSVLPTNPHHRGQRRVVSARARGKERRGWGEGRGSAGMPWTLGSRLPGIAVPKRPRWTAARRCQRLGPLPSSNQTPALASGPRRVRASPRGHSLLTLRCGEQPRADRQQRQRQEPRLGLPPRSHVCRYSTRAHDADGSAQMRPSPPRHRRARNRARESPEGEASWRDSPVPRPAARPTPPAGLRARLPSLS